MNAFPNPPVQFLPEYVPSRAEADREAAMPKCSVNWYRATVGGAVAVEKGVGTRCPACGGVHLMLDVFDDQAQVTKATAGSQHNIAGFIRDDDGVIRYGLGNALPGATVKSILGYDLDAAFNVPPYITKQIGTDDPRIITKG